MQEFTLPAHSVIAEEPSAAIKPGTVIIKSGKSVKDLQNILDMIGYGKLLGPKGIDGKFGPATKQAVSEFQKEHRDPLPKGTEPGAELGTRHGGELDDGIVGEKTVRALTMALIGDPPQKEATEFEADEDQASVPLTVGRLCHREFKLKIKGISYAIAGQVTDAHSLLIPNVDLSITGAADQSPLQRKTDSEGRFFVKELKTGKYRVEVKSDDYEGVHDYDVVAK